jgi:tetratricopeptide (TPR) repeat protein
MTMRFSIVLSLVAVAATAHAPAAHAGSRAPLLRAQSAPATQTPQPEVRLDRGSVFDRLLAPREAGPTAGAPASKAKDLALGAESYKRGLVFVQQGAWKEAEQALRAAEKRDGNNLEYQLSTAFVYLKLHRPDDAMRRYQRIYKTDPTHLRALVGMAATYDEMQFYRDEIGFWMRYVKMDLSPAQREEGERMLRSAQDLFVQRWEIAENPRGGATKSSWGCRRSSSSRRPASRSSRTRSSRGTSRTSARISSCTPRGSRPSTSCLC